MGGRDGSQTRRLGWSGDLGGPGRRRGCGAAAQGALQGELGQEGLGGPAESLSGIPSLQGFSTYLGHFLNYY